MSDTVTDAAIYRALARGIAPPTKLTVSQCAERYRVLSSKSSAEPGAWRNSRTPYLVEIMDRLSTSDPCRVVALEAGAQTGKTETGNNWAGPYVIKHAPAPMMVVLPTEEMARRSVSQRFEPMIDESPVLRELVTEARAKDNGSRQFLKQFPGGMILFAWAKSPATLRSMPAQYLFLDEVDAVEAGGDEGEGDFIHLALARSRTFAKRKALIVSTPTLKRTSRIDAWFRKGDQRRYMVPCPFCNARQVLSIAGLKWERDADGNVEPGSVAYECEACAQRIEENWKTEMLPAGVWTPTATAADRYVTSYHLPSFYSPLGWLGWEEIAGMFVEAHREMKEYRNPEKMKVFVNTVEARPWDEDDGDSVTQWSVVAARADDYPPGIVPSSVLMLTAGVDVQDDRLEVSVYGWGADEEAWLITHDVFSGDPGREDVWAQLDELLMTDWPTDDGRSLRIVSTAIDSGGHYTQDVYAFTRPRARRNIVAIKGANTASAPAIGKPTLQDVDHRGQRIKAGVQLWMLGVHQLKRILARRLRIAEPGPGRIHTYAGIDDGWYQQLCGEFLATRHKGGSTVETWTKVRPSQAVEAWDCLVYAYAAALRVGMVSRGLLKHLAAARDRSSPRPRHAPRPALPEASDEAPEPGEGPAVRTVTASSQPPPRRRANRSAWLSR